MATTSDPPVLPCAQLDRRVCAFLLSLTDGHAEQVIETHASCVFLTKSEALKIKKPVTFPYLDYSTLPLRQAACHKEFQINATAAPEIYLGVSQVTRRANGHLELDGDGEPVEFIVRMRRFAQEDVFDVMARQDRLRVAHMAPLAEVIHRSHEHAPKGVDRKAGDALRRVFSDTIARVRKGKGVLGETKVNALSHRTEGAFARVEELLLDRAERGWVRRCHGDLHLRNIVMWKGAPVLFDALEFSDALATTDVLYDLAFVVMDLLHRDLKPHANALVNAYFANWTADDLAAVAAMPLLISIRAGVRAKVALDRAASDPGADEEAREYLRLAHESLALAKPRLIAVGGLSGSGKSVLAAHLAPLCPGPVGALVVRSDVERKLMAGVTATDRLPASAYTSEATQAVYERLRAKAGAVLAAGQSVIVDAVHAREQERFALERIATAANVDFAGIWLNCAEPVRMARADARRNDASDADASIARQQSSYEVGQIMWTQLDSAGEFATLLRAAERSVFARTTTPE